MEVEQFVYDWWPLILLAIYVIASIPEWIDWYAEVSGD